MFLIFSCTVKQLFLKSKVNLRGKICFLIKFFARILVKMKFDCDIFKENVPVISDQFTTFSGIFKAVYLSKDLKTSSI